MKRRTRCRRGFTLIELLIAMTAGTVLMGLLAATVSRVLRTNATSAEHLEVLATVGRMAEQLRGDVHAAASVSVEPGEGRPRRLRLDRPDGATIAYEIVPTGLVRTLSEAGQVRGRETFAAPTMKLIGWNDDAAATGLVSLRVGRLARQGNNLDAVASQFTIDAALAGGARKKGGA